MRKPKQVRLRPLGPAVADARRIDAPPGSGNAAREVDEEIWDEFEAADNAVVPSGLASLPWSAEYRALAAAARTRRERRAALLTRESDLTPQLYELASVYVAVDARRRGLGSELVRRLLARHAQLGRASSDVYLLTLGKTAAWYCALGFELVADADVPAPMTLEFKAGSWITRLIGEDLVCMRGGAAARKLR